MLDALFKPNSVAVIGASTKELSIGNRVIKNLQDFGYKGPIYPINPKADEVRGIKSYGSILDVEEQVDLAWVPGSFEIPMAAKRLAGSGRYAAVICLGCLIQGDTPHFHYIAAEVTKGIAQVSLDAAVPVVFGVITAETLDQAIERAGTKAGNKGFDAALTALEMIDLCGAIDKG